MTRGGGGTMVVGEYDGGAKEDLYVATFADETVFANVTSILISGPAFEKSSNIGNAVVGDPD